jgi:hypothetical protein
VNLKFSTQAAIALIVTLASVAAFAALMVVPVPAANAHQFDLALGNLEGAFVTAVAFYLGSSRGSAAKDAVIAKATEALGSHAQNSNGSQT